MLSAENLTLGYPGKMLCQHLNITMKAGECWGILGRNGSGKSTLLHVLGGVQKPLAGTVSIENRSVQQLPRLLLAQKIGLLLQEEASLFTGTVRDYVVLGRYPHHGLMMGWQEKDDMAVQYALTCMELDGLASRTVTTLSGGERQRVRIAMLLAQMPDIFGLDEPLLHLDIGHQAAVMKLFCSFAAEQHKTVVMVLHDILWASRYCDHVLLLYGNGRVASGPTRELLVKSNLEELYQCKMQELIIDQEMHYVPQ